MEPVSAGSLQVWRDHERFRDLVIDANDRIVAIAGVIEGVLGARLGNRAAATAVVARWGDVPLSRTVARNVAVGLTAMAVSFAVGSLIEA